jgi:putative nucleotidyltransferase with HDIG domain
MLIRAGYPLHPLWAVVVLGGAAAVAERSGVAVTDRVEMSASFLPLVFAAVALGPLAGFAAGAVSNAADLRRPYLRWFAYTPIRAMTVAATGLVAGRLRGEGFGAYLIVSSVGCLTLIVVDAIFNSLTLAVRKSGTALAYPRAVIPIFALVLPLYGPLVGLFVYAYHAYSLFVVVVFLIPALALQRLIHLYQHERVASGRLIAANERLRRANLSFATALVATLDARDRYTAGHSAAVAIYARDIAERMALSDDQCRLVHLSGLVHDIGKIGLPAGLLEKPGALALDERRQMEKHSEIGEDILRNVDDYSEIADIVRHHHERVDGLGYPDGLRGETIPLLARIIAVADAYNAMTSDRPYRDALPSRVARLRLAQAVSSQFDTSVVAAFEAILASSDETYRTATSPQFVLESWQSPSELEALTSGGNASQVPAEDLVEL